MLVAEARSVLLGGAARRSGRRRPLGCSRWSLYLTINCWYHGFVRTIIDVDDALLEAAQAELGTSTKKDTVNEALRFVAEREARRQAALNPYLFGGGDLGDAEVMAGARR
jgi:Arc/MetJ family transcription regulator